MCVFEFHHGLDIIIKAHVGVDVPVEWFVRADLAVDALIVYAYLGVGEVVMNLEVEVVVVGADLRVDVAVDMSFRFVEVAEGDPAVETILEWEVELGIVCAIC